MLTTRVIPCLLLQGRALVKTVRFRAREYVGDPINTVRIFNELQVDELVLLDIDATREGRGPDWDLLREVADECFMPVAYGGGISSVEEVERVLRIGFEKVVLNTMAWRRPELVRGAAALVGSQSVVGSVDVRRSIFGRYRAHVAGGTEVVSKPALAWIEELVSWGAGEILLTSMDRDGTWSGYDLDFVREVVARVPVPVVASGGAGSVDDLVSLVRETGVSGAGVGSMVVFQKRGMGVLVNFPDRGSLDARLEDAVAGFNQRSARPR